LGVANGAASSTLTTKPIYNKNNNNNKETGIDKELMRHKNELKTKINYTAIALMLICHDNN